MLSQKLHSNDGDKDLVAVFVTPFENWHIDHTPVE